MIGVLLVLLTWTALLVIWTISGAAATTARITPNAGNFRTRARRSLWWGLAIFTLIVLTVGFFLPLRSAAAALAVIVLLAPLATIGIRSLIRTRRSTAKSTNTNTPLARRLLIGALLIATGFLAWAALGPVTNYDTGLYHLGAIGYAGDYPTIPGLANLYFPFGYANAQFPLAAFLGNGPWGGEGYRLLNGLLFAALATDLALRGRSRSLGSYVLVVGAVVVAVPMVALEDYWITSPTSDSAVFISSTVSIAYLADGLSRSSRKPNHAAAAGADLLVALVLAVLTVTLRPLMAVFALAMLAVVLTVQIRGRKGSSGPRIPRAAWGLGIVLAAALGGIQTLRDYRLSGWLQYPLSIGPFPVPWRAPDPVWNRTPTLGAARDPADLWAATEGWNWIGAWIARLPSQWETYLLVLILLAAVIAAIPVRRNFPTRVVLLVLTPVLTVDLVWFFASPPSFRFAWGPIFALGVVPLGAALWAWDRRDSRPALDQPAILAASLAVLAITAFTAITRSDPLTRTDTIEWQLAGLSVSLPATPIADAPVTERTLDSGLQVLIPTESDQCWTNYPLCTAQLESTVALRGDGIADGFTP